jgi:hypothetical protein
MNLHTATALTCVALAALGCTPALDWREVQPERSGLTALFPCKPASQVRQLALAGVRVEMALYACSAGGATYAIGFAEIGQPQLVGHALAELAAAAVRNVGANRAPASAPLHVEGATPNARAGRQTFDGWLADGQHVLEQVAVFARGTRVFQVTMVGARLDADAIDTFFGGLRLTS